MTELVLATSNPHKIEEMTAIFERLAPGLGIRLIGLTEALHGRSAEEPPETGKTFEANALIKASAYAAQTGRWCLADDSGLEVDALDGRPGVISSHYCTDGRETGMTRQQRDLANNHRVLGELDGVEPALRTARFVCVMCLAGAGDPITVRGTFEGRIGLPGEVPRGSNGFGYDPLFLVAPACTKTSAELSPDEKNRLSHRAVAATLMADRLRNLSL